MASFDPATWTGDIIYVRKRADGWHVEHGETDKAFDDNLFAYYYAMNLLKEAPIDTAVVILPERMRDE